MEFIDYSLGEPKYSVEESKERDVTYAAPLRVKVRLINKETGEVKEQEVFMGDFPLMTIQVRLLLMEQNVLLFPSWFVHQVFIIVRKVDKNGKKALQLQ